MMKFNYNRFNALFQKEFHKGFWGMAKAISIIALAIYIILTLTLIFGDTDDKSLNIINNFGIFLFIGGLIYASLVFSEFWKGPSRAEYLSLPASNLEKILVKWLYSNPLFILFASVLFYLLTIVFNLFWSGYGAEVINGIFISKLYWNLVGIYFTVHAIFFFGSIAFNKVSVIQTIAYLVMILLVLALFLAIYFRIYFHDWFDGLFSPASFAGSMRFGVNYRSPDEMPQIKIVIFMFKYVMAPVLWVASIFKLSEKEV